MMQSASSRSKHATTTFSTAIERNVNSSLAQASPDSQDPTVVFQDLLATVKGCVSPSYTTD